MCIGVQPAFTQKHILQGSWRGDHLLNALLIISFPIPAVAPELDLQVESSFLGSLDWGFLHNSTERSEGAVGSIRYAHINECELLPYCITNECSAAQFIIASGHPPAPSPPT